jgi:hypothetical protein
VGGRALSSGSHQTKYPAAYVKETNLTDKEGVREIFRGPVAAPMSNLAAHREMPRLGFRGRHGSALYLDRAAS